MCAKIMRPTKVRATVGSRASGSSASPTVRVPPFVIAAEVPACAAAEPSARTDATASPRSEKRTVEPLMYVVLLGRRSNGSRAPNLSRARAQGRIQFSPPPRDPVLEIQRGLLADADSLDSQDRTGDRTLRALATLTAPMAHLTMRVCAPPLTLKLPGLD